MNILFVHEVSYLQKVVYEMHDFPELLAERGHSVIFLDFPEALPRSGGRRILDLRTTVTKNVNRSHQGGMIEVRTPGRVLAPPLDRIAAPITHGPELARILRERKIDIVVLYAVPTNGWLALRVARRAGIPVLFRAIDVSHLLRRTQLAPLIRRAERLVLRTADWVSTHNSELLAYCISEGADPNRCSLEYPGVDLDRFRPVADRMAIRAALGFNAVDRIAVFMGTLYRFAGLDWLITEIAPHLLDDRRRKLLIIGDGEERDSLQRHVMALGLDESVRLIGRIDYDALPDALGVADVAVNPFGDSVVTHCALPGKVLQYMACGLPTISTPLRGLRSVVGDDHGVSFRPSHEPFVTATVDLLDNPESAAAAGQAARATLESKFRWSDCITRFEHRLETTARKYSAREVLGRRRSKVRR